MTITLPLAAPVSLRQVISAVAFCPQPPLLVPQLAGGAGDDLATLRDACCAAIACVAGAGRRLVLLGAAAESGTHSSPARGSLAGYGVDIDVHLGAPDGKAAFELPLSLTIGAWLVQAAQVSCSDAVGYAVGPGFAGSGAAGELATLIETHDIALLVIGDGSARRGVTAPGYLDPRAVPFDDAIAVALATGDAAALARLDPELGAAVLAAGVAPWRAAGALLTGGRYRADVLYADDPYGVAYFVATWMTGA